MSALQIILLLIFGWLLNYGYSKIFQHTQEKAHDAEVDRYARIGARNNSFYFHAIAYCKENDIPFTTYDSDEDSSLNQIEFTYEHYNRIRIYPDEKQHSLFHIEMVTLGVDSDNPIIDQTFDALRKRHSDVFFGSMMSRSGIKWITVDCTMEADASEEDARNYISGFIDDVLNPATIELRQDFDKRNADLKTEKYHWGLDRKKIVEKLKEAESKLPDLQHIKPKSVIRSQ